ncbi:hypothetical protein [Acidiphilium sp. 34-64-41]|uniref:hypothetical protein n=1 Tax=Acidiphilium sp. 34-64-41 TaxID=1970297 RepID=UPI0033902455
MARILEGVTRNAGKHAGGVVIAPTKITDFSPLYCDEEAPRLPSSKSPTHRRSVQLSCPRVQGTTVGSRLMRTRSTRRPFMARTSNRQPP